MRAHVSRGLNWLRLGGACAIVIASAAMQGCGSSGGSSSQDPGAGDASLADGTAPPAEGGPSVEGGSDAGALDAPGFVDVAIDAGTPCDPDGAVDIDCTGRCGPVRDTCSGTVKMCGGCSPAALIDGGFEPQVCDLTTNTCVKPRVTCADLNAQCGTVRDSCGDFLDCPDTNPKDHSSIDSAGQS